MSYPRLLITAALLLAALAAATVVEAAPGKTAIPALDPQRLPQLPVQGLVVQRAHDILLVGLDGKPIGTLPRFAGPYTGKTYVLEALAQADPAAVLLTDASHRAYVLDPATSRLRRLGAMRLPLAGGAMLAAHAVLQPSPYLPKIMLEVVQRGRVVGTRSQSLRVVDGRLVVSGGTVFDTVTGIRWRIGKTESSLPGGCEPAGVSGANLVAICATGKYPSLKVRAYRISRSGARTGVGPTMRWGFGARTAALSPDGRFVGITLDVGCGAPVGAITPLGAGRAGYVGNGKAVGSKAAINSEALGWTPEGKLVAHIIFPPTDCEHAPPTGVYAVDPATFARTLIFQLPKHEWALLWNAGPS
jgi:hypothetical protein